MAGLPDTASGTVETRDLDDLVTLLGEVDVAFTSVGMAHPLVGRDHLEAALVRRTGPSRPGRRRPRRAPQRGAVGRRTRRSRAARHGRPAGRGRRCAGRTPGRGGLGQRHRVRRGGALPGRLPGPRRGADGVGPAGCGRGCPMHRAGPPAVQAGPISTTPSGSRWTRSPGPWWPSCSTSRRWS